MRIIDISRELFTSPVYPGDPRPSFERLRRIDHGDGCNLSAFYTGSHSATHLDAPLHFVDGGETIDIPRGTRQMQTFRKLPMQQPNMRLWLKDIQTKLSCVIIWLRLWLRMASWQKQSKHMMLWKALWE